MTCIDKMNNCAAYGQGVCTSYGEWAHDNCQQFCGFCGKIYTFLKAAANWFLMNFILDYFNHACKCLYFLGPTTTSNGFCKFTLVLVLVVYRKWKFRAIFQRCKRKCRSNEFQKLIITKTNKEKYVLFIVDGKCSYKGNSYQTGESWKDGCDYECVCEDGQAGKYRCFNK